MMVSVSRYTTMMLAHARNVAAAGTMAGVTVCSAAAYAQVAAEEARVWRVVGVAADDALNVRMGPGTEYPVIGTFAYNERGLEVITCVPFYTYEQFIALSEAERRRLPPRWCLVTGASYEMQGWVNQRFLAED